MIEKTRYITFIEIFMVLLFLLGIYLGSITIYQFFPAWYGYLGGAILGAVFSFATIFLTGFLLDRILCGIPAIPECRNGCCHCASGLPGEDDYDLKKVNDEILWVCKCGEYYKKNFNRFLFVEENGKVHSYLKWHPFKGWISDKID